MNGVSDMNLDTPHDLFGSDGLIVTSIIKIDLRAPEISLRLRLLETGKYA